MNRAKHFLSVMLVFSLASLVAYNSIKVAQPSLKASNALFQSITQDEEYCTYYDWRNASSPMEHDYIQRCFTREWAKRGYDSIISGFDSLDLPCLISDDLPMKEAIVDWDDNWLPHGYSLEECKQKLSPQLWENPVSLQDLCALYLFEEYTCKDIVPQMTIESFSQLLIDNCHSSSETLIHNIAIILQLVTAQEERVVEVDGVVDTDLDNDGCKEHIELIVSEDEDKTIRKYQLYVNHQLVEVFYNAELLVELIDLQSCKVICVKPIGESDRSDLDHSRRDALFGYIDGDARFLGALSGHFTAFIGNGRFMTTEKVNYPDQLFTTSAVESITHEYGLTSDGLLYHVSHGREDFLESPFGWQQQNTLWELREDIPLYTMDGITLSSNVLKKGDRIIIRGVSENGYLYLCGEDGIGGVIRLIRPQIEPQDPFVGPGGRRLSYYFKGYDGLAYGDGWEG